MAALNVLSLMLYIDEIRIILQHGVLHILDLNKTRLDLSIPNQLVNVDDYDIIRSDRNRSGGGVCVYIKKDLIFQIDLILSQKTSKQFV